MLSERNPPEKCLCLPEPLRYQQLLRHRAIQQIQHYLRQSSYINTHLIEISIKKLHERHRNDVCFGFLHRFLHMRSNRLNDQDSKEIKIIILAFLNACPASTKVIDSDGDLLFHKILEWGNIDHEILRAVMEAMVKVSHEDPCLERDHENIADDSFAVTTFNQLGYAPIHSLLWSLTLNAETLKLLLFNYPNIARVRTESGMLPLHVLMKRKDIFQHVETLAILIRAYPAALTEEYVEYYTRMNLDGSPPSKVVDRWTPHSRAMTSTLTVRQVVEKELQTIVMARRMPSLLRFTA